MCKVSVRNMIGEFGSDMNDYYAFLVGYFVAAKTLITTFDLGGGRS